VIVASHLDIHQMPPGHHHRADSRRIVTLMNARILQLPPPCERRLKSIAPGRGM
jgi:hypothetical protein